MGSTNNSGQEAAQPAESALKSAPGSEQRNGSTQERSPLEEDFGRGGAAEVLLPQEKVRVDLSTEEWAHRQSQQQSTFSTVAALATLLYFGAFILAGFAMWLSYTNPERADWHVWIVVASFLLAPTVLLIGITRATYSKTSGNDGDIVSDVPLISALKELVSVAKQIFNKGTD